MHNFQGKRALVTGAASGIGRALAEALAAQGCCLWLWDVDEVGLLRVQHQLVSRGQHAIARKCDLAAREELDRGLEELVSCWGAPEILVNNAGIVYWGPTVNMTADEWDRVLSINLLAPVRITRTLLPGMLEYPEAHIVNVASLFGLVTTRRSCAYHTSKFGLVGFGEALRTEFGRHGLGVSTMCPGFVTTNLFRNGISGRQDREVPSPPRWICTTPEKVAQRTVRAIRRNERLVVMTPLGHLLYIVKRFSPSLLDWMSQFGRTRKVRARLAEYERLAA